jgi:hypothetical protein
MSVTRVSVSVFDVQQPTQDRSRRSEGQRVSARVVREFLHVEPYAELACDRPRARSESAWIGDALEGRSASLDIDWTHARRSARPRADGKRLRLSATPWFCRRFRNLGCGDEPLKRAA